MQKTFFYLLGLAVLIIGLPLSFSGAEAADTPSLSFGIGGGFFEASDDDFRKEIDRGIGRMSLNYLFCPWLEVGIGGMAQSKLVASDLNMRARINFMEDQVLVPFGGGGIDMYWVLGDFSVAGDNINRQGGYHWEGGLQLLLDYFDPSQSKEIQKKWGVENSYFSIGYRQTEIDNFGKADVNIGGKMFFGEILVEF